MGEVNVSVFTSAKSKSPYASNSLYASLMLIKIGAYMRDVLMYRATKDKRDKLKVECFTPSGLFSQRKNSEIIEYNGVVCLDIDGKDNPDVDMDELFSKFSSSKMVYGVHRSISGNGLAVYIQTTNTRPEHHSDVCTELIEQVEKHLSVSCDRACVDVSRLRFFSYDKDTHINEKATMYNFTPKPRRTNREAIPAKEIEDREARGLKFFIGDVIQSGVDITGEYSDWVKISFIIAETFGEDGRIMFHQLSELNHGYVWSKCDKLYSSSLQRINNDGNSVGVKTFYKIASDYGIKRCKN